jgi:hypothetical protein
MSSSTSGATSFQPELPRELPAHRGFSVLYRGKTLLSRIDPVGQGERLATGITGKDRTLYFCPSPLYGYGLEILIKKLGSNSAVLCAEVDKHLFELSRKSLGALLEPDSDGFRKVCLVNLTGEESASAVCAYVRNVWGERRFRRVEVLRFTGGWQLFPHIYDETVSALRRDMATGWGNAMTLIKLGRLYIKNAIRNLALLPQYDDVSSLDYGAAPVLALGAGPSLDGILDRITAAFGSNALNPENRDFRIVCADTCIPCLKERDIRPDLVVILESQHWNLRDFTGVKGWPVDAAFDLSSLPASARVLGGKSFIFTTPWTELRLFGRLERQGLLPMLLIPLGSVGLTAVELARRLSSGPVITGGIDCSFTADRYHARSAPGHLTRLAGSSRFSPLVNAAAAFRAGTFTALSKTGLPVRSDPAMRGYRDLFEQEFGPDRRIFDIEGPGLPLGVATLTMDQALEKLAACREKKAPVVNAGNCEAKCKTVKAFIEQEMSCLIKLKNILTGTSIPEELGGLLDDCDYLWAHFPECAGAGGRRPEATDLSFLKRVRAEIEPFIKVWEASLRELPFDK